MSNELKESIEALVREKSISRDILFDTIENALLSACRNQFGRTDNIIVDIDRDNYSYSVWAEKTVVETEEDVMDGQTEISLEEALKLNPAAAVGDSVRVPINSMNLGRISTTNAKNVITQKIREEERSAVYNQYAAMQKDVVTGVVQRRTGSNFSINLGRADGLLPENEQVPGEHLKPTDRIKVYIVEVRAGQREGRGSGAPRILVSRTHPELVKRLFEQEVAEIRDGIVEIRSIAREAGSRTKIAVWSNNPNVDPVGACVGVNGTRVSSIVEELGGEKIDIINWDENPGNFIQNALSPAKISAVFADPEARTAKVVVPDYQLSLAIGREGQNARLAAKLTNYKIDIKSETQAKNAPGFRYEDYLDGGDGDEEVEFIDEFGNPVDINGNPLPPEEIMYVDENGNPVDEYGNPIEVYEEDGAETEE
ncbi:transcription termination factor NusA [Lachnoclostridium sp. Marseille-P6806]|uniref:transcription termination factor NusA n=1 Tax=Lachnoclostridium sp. Marseille-P6806 TaxID=2364793 RepID=UPI00102FB177|nr:transcription termination factor NusA [Lachnoclostridium sp. Marseille-P6806]